MLYHLLYPLSKTFSGFNVFRYITFRSAGAVITALIVSFLLGPWIIAACGGSRSASRCATTAPRPI